MKQKHQVRSMGKQQQQKTGNEKQSNHQQRRNAMIVNNQHISVMPLNVNGLNSPVKRHRLVNWIRKQNPTACYIQETHLMQKDVCRLKIKEWKTIFHAPGPSKLVGIAILISGRVNFKLKQIRRDEDGHSAFYLREQSNKKTYIDKYLCTKYWSTCLHKTNTAENKGINKC